MNTDQKRTLKRHGRKRRTLGWTLLTLGLLGMGVWAWSICTGRSENWWSALSFMLYTPAALLLRSGNIARRRAMKGLCRKCGYDLAGLAAGAPCPECGKGAKTRPPTAGIYTAGPNGLIITSVSAVASPLGFIGVLFMGYSSLAIVGSFLLLGMVLCAVGCFRQPRTSAVTGLIVGTLCLLFWTVFCVWMMVSVRSQP